MDNSVCPDALHITAKNKITFMFGSVPQRDYLCSKISDFLHNSIATDSIKPLSPLERGLQVPFFLSVCLFVCMSVSPSVCLSVLNLFVQVFPFAA